jgi:hypothetical protein
MVTNLVSSKYCVLSIAGSVPIDRHTACPIGGATLLDITAWLVRTSKKLQRFSIMSIPTSLEVHEESGA